MKAQHGDRDIEQGDLQSLPLALLVACCQGGEHGIARHHACRHVHDGRTGAQRLAVGITVERHETAFGLYHRVETGAVRQRPMASIG